MKTLEEYVDDARFNARCRTDDELAEKSGITASYISLFRSGKMHPTTDQILILANLGGNDPMRAIVELSAQRLKDSKSKYGKKRLNLLNDMYNIEKTSEEKLTA